MAFFPFFFYFFFYLIFFNFSFEFALTLAIGQTEITVTVTFCSLHFGVVAHFVPKRIRSDTRLGLVRPLTPFKFKIFKWIFMSTQINQTPQWRT